MNIAIIEYKQNIEEALKHFRLKNTLFLSVSGEASYHLLKRNIDFITDEDILSPDKFKKLGHQNFEIAEKWIQQLERLLHATTPGFNQSDFFPFRWHFHKLKMLIDTVRIKYILLERLIKKENPQFIGFPKGADAEYIHDHNLFFHRYDSVYGLLAKLVVREEKINTISWSKVNPPLQMWPQFKKFIKKQLSKNKFLDKVLLYKRISCLRKGNILLNTTEYDIGPLIRTLSPRYNFYLYGHPLSIRPLGSFAKVQHTASNIPNLSTIDMNTLNQTIKPTKTPIVNKILQNRIYAYITRIVPVVCKGFSYLEAVDREKKFKAFFQIGGITDSFLGLPAYYFQRRNKPMIVVQHGEYGIPFKKISTYSECGHNGYYFSYGEGVAQMYENRKKGTCKIIPTGSHLLENIRKRQSVRKRIKNVCYVPTTYGGNTTYYPSGQSCCDSKLFLTETSFLKTLIPFQKEYNITYKVAPRWKRYNEIMGHNPLIPWLKENFARIKIVAKPLTAVIHNFDCFIIDWPSTALLQALATGAEVVVYTGNEYHIFTREALKLLRPRAIIGETEKDFQDKIRKVLDSGVVASNVEDTSFLERYGIYKDDGMSLKRMIDNIEHILARKKE